jgi:hypothetical protein
MNLNKYKIYSPGETNSTGEERLLRTPDFRLQTFPNVFSETKKTTGLPETGLVRVITTVS